MKEKKLSVIIPCFNEKDTIEKIIDKVSNVNLDDIKKEIIVIDDASKDETVQILKTKIEPKVSKVIYKEKNAGKGATLRTGFENATIWLKY